MDIGIKKIRKSHYKMVISDKKIVGVFVANTFVSKDNFSEKQKRAAKIFQENVLEGQYGT